MSVKQILVLPHLKINNANAWASPYSAGFPSVCAFGGAVHALQRKLNENGFDNLAFVGFGIINHRFNLRSYKGAKDSDLSVIASANPLGKDGKRQPFVPEIKCMMDISLLCELDGNISDKEETLKETVLKLINGDFRIASGDILPTKEIPFLIKVGSERQDKDFSRYVVRKLMPGYALIERRELMIESMKQGKDAMDALLEHMTVIANPIQLSNGNIEIERRKKVQAWLVPISTGYAAISNLGKAINQRDDFSPHCFAESIVTLGEFRMLHRVPNVDALLWRGSYNAESSIYSYSQSEKEVEEDLFDISLI